MHCIQDLETICQQNTLFDGGGTSSVQFHSVPFKWCYMCSFLFPVHPQSALFLYLIQDVGATWQRYKALMELNGTEWNWSILVQAAC